MKAAGFDPDAKMSQMGEDVATAEAEEAAEVARKHWAVVRGRFRDAVAADPAEPAAGAAPPHLVRHGGAAGAGAGSTSEASVATQIQESLGDAEPPWRSSPVWT